MLSSYLFFTNNRGIFKLCGESKVEIYLVVDCLRASIDKRYIRSSSKRKETPVSTKKVNPPRSIEKEKDSMSTIEHYRNLISMYAVANANSVIYEVITKC